MTHLVDTAGIIVPGGDEKKEENAEEGGGEEGKGDENKDGDIESKKLGLPTFDPYSNVDLSAISGLKKIPELLLALSAKHPYFGDICKAQMLGWEFKIDTKPPESYCFASATGLMDAAIEKSGGEEKEVWFSGLVG